MDEFGVGEFARDIGKRTAQVRREKIKNLLGAGSETLGAQLPIQKNRSDIGRGHQIIEIRIGPAQIFDAVLQLVVDRSQFFVDRLQFFLARLELFRGRAHLLVHGLELFV